MLFPTFYHLVVDSLLTRDHDVELLGAVLESLRLGFDAPVSVQHVQDAVLCISERVASRKCAFIIGVVQT